MDFLELIKNGGITIYPLLISSIISIAIIIDKFFEFYLIDRTLKALHPQMIKFAEDRQYKKMLDILRYNIY